MIGLENVHLAHSPPLFYDEACVEWQWMSDKKMTTHFK